MIELATVALILLVCLVVRVLHLASPGQCPSLHCRDPQSPLVQAIINACPILTTVYNPPSFWGKSGHLQTILHVTMGRVKPTWPNSERIHIPMPDGATASYDIFSPESPEKTGNYILAVCPGIANSSECIYLRTFAAYANSHGYRIAILNHLGAIRSEQLTSPRIFTYGGTEEFGAMVDRLRQDYPSSTILAIGFSMGGNIITKYLGESLDNQRKIMCGMSVCQGYEVNEAMPLFLQWAHLRRVYTYFMTLNQRRLLNRHRSLLFGEKATQQYGQLHESVVFSATNLSQIDTNDTCIRTGFPTVYDYYKWCSSAYHMHNIKIPMFYMNSEDDPVVPVPLLKHPKEQAGKADNCIFMTTKHGGHLGYFEGGYLVPDNVTWLDRVLIQYADAITSLHEQDLLPPQTGLLTEPVNKLDMNCEDQSAKDVSVVETRVDGSSTECYKRQVTADGKEKDINTTSAENQEKKNSLKRGTILQQATSYVQ